VDTGRAFNFLKERPTSNSVAGPMVSLERVLVGLSSALASHLTIEGVARGSSSAPAYLLPACAPPHLRKKKRYRSRPSCHAHAVRSHPCST
jgi:hypothetical protein